MVEMSVWFPSGKPCRLHATPRWILWKSPPTPVLLSAVSWILESSSMSGRRKTVRRREPNPRSNKNQLKKMPHAPKTNEAAPGLKGEDARRWLLQGNKVRVTIKFRGREMDY